MIAIRWENGEIDRAATWQALLDHVRETQWRSYDTEAEFRSEMAHRALVWSGPEIDPGGTPEHFFNELERANLIRIKPRDERAADELAHGSLDHRGGPPMLEPRYDGTDDDT